MKKGCRWHDKMCIRYRYKPFFRKNATEKETLMVGRVLVLVLSFIAYVIANSKGSGCLLYTSRCV